MSTKIAWTNETWNPIIGCSKASEGCKNCYAEKMAYRLSNMPHETGCDYAQVTGGRSGWNGTTAFVESQLEKPMKRKKATMYFVCSMGDLFHDSVPFEWVDKVMAIIALCPQHTFQVLTKRPWRMKEYFESVQSLPLESERDMAIWDAWRVVRCGCESENRPAWPLKNLWLGTTCENQEMADKRIPVLLQIPAAKRFVSVEPMLGAVEIERYLLSDYDKAAHDNQMTGRENRDNKLNWVICGGESGPSARPMHPDWARSLRDQCEYPGVPFFFKSWGEWEPVKWKGSSICAAYPSWEYGKGHFASWLEPTANFPHSKTGWHYSSIPVGIATVAKVGKKKAGSLLDDKEHKEFPEVNNA